MKSCKITIVCPWWRRLQVTALHCRSIKNFINRAPRWAKIQYLCIVSPDDPDRAELIKMAHEFGFIVTSYKNLPIGAKLNAGINTAVRHTAPDYIMNMGSDDLCNVSIFEEYENLIRSGVLFFGIDSVYIYNPETKETYYLNLYTDVYPVGVLRMVHVSLIQKLKAGYGLSLYPASVCCGMDTASFARLSKIGYPAKVIYVNRRPFTVGIKCNVSINHWMHLSTIDRAERCERKEIKNLLKGII